MFSDNTLPAIFVIGAFRKAAKLSLEGMTIEQALIKVAQEIEDGFRDREAGKTEVILQKDIMEGNFIGDLK